MKIRKKQKGKQMNKKNHLKGQQNKGFTLVELLIAMTILAIIVVPLLQAFVSSSRTNAKAKQLMKATTVAQNIMEELKANSLEDVARQFNNNANRTYTTKNSIAGLATGNTPTDDPAWEGVLSSGSYSRVTTSDQATAGISANASILDDAVLTTNTAGVFVGQASGEYHFLLQGVARESAKFDVALDIIKDAENGTHTLTQINAMNQADCGYFAEGSETSNAITTFLSANESYQDNPLCHGTLNTDDIYLRMDRTITVDIASSGTNQTVSVQYNYELDPGYTRDEDRYYGESITIFDNYLSAEPLNAVYIYYFPLYEGEDTINVVNNNNLDVDVYLIKMIKSQGSSNNTYTDDNYAPKVELKETVARANGESNAILCTNINVKSGFRYNVPNGELRETDLGNEKSTDCFYDVKVSVYRHDASDPFDEANYIASLTGSMMDNSKKVNR